MTICDFCGNSLSDSQYLHLNNKVYKSCPECSQKNKQHIHYFCPEAFGTTSARISSNSPIGIQSQCAKCRSKKNGPHDGAFPCSDVKKCKGYIISEIRFLPMGKTVFCKYEEAANFLANTMPNRGGTYYYQASKMNCAESAFVLFQYDGELIGYAIYYNTVEFEHPILMDDGNSYNGYYQFDPESIYLLKKPILTTEYKEIDQSFKKFGQGARKLLLDTYRLLWI